MFATSARKPRSLKPAVSALETRELCATSSSIYVTGGQAKPSGSTTVQVVSTTVAPTQGTTAVKDSSYASTTYGKSSG